MADKSSETSAALSEEASKTGPTNLTSSSPDSTVKGEQAKKATTSGVMDPPALNMLMHKWLAGLYTTGTKPAKVTVPPVDVPDGSQPMDAVLTRLTTQMQLNESPKTSLCAGGTHLTVFARSLATHLNIGLTSKDLENVSTRICEETTKWLLSFFKLPPNSFTSLYHDNAEESLVKVIRIALNMRYGKHLTEGTENVLHTRPPAIYISAAGNPVACQNACMQLNIPLSSITTVPCNTVFGSTHAMDIAALENCINEDTAKGKTPLLVVGNAGTKLAGHFDNFARLREISTEYNIWLHVEGNAIPLLCVKNETLELKPLQDVDSMLLEPGVWFGLLGTTCVTLCRRAYTYKSQGSKPEKPAAEESETSAEAKEEAKEEASTPSDGAAEKPSSGGHHHSVTRQLPLVTWLSLSPYGSSRLSSLPLWINLQHLGFQTLSDTIKYSNNLAKMMISGTQKIPGIKRIEAPNHWCHVVLLKYVGGGELKGPANNSKPVDTPVPPQEVNEPQQQDNGPPPAAEDKPPLPTASADGDKPPATSTSTPAVADAEDTSNNSSTAEDKESVASVASAPTMVVRQTKINVIPELPDASANAFTQLLAVDLMKQFYKLGLTTVNIPRHGNCIRFDPVVSFPDVGSSRKDVENFCTALEEKAREYHPTALARPVFQSAILECKNLRYLDFPASIAVGFVQYIPLDWVSKKELTVEEVRKLNQHNIELAKALVQHTALFTTYQHGNFTCIALKSLIETDDIYQLIELLKSETLKYEESSKYIEGMSDMIMKGIEAAQKDLAIEKEKMLQEESVLKNIPVVGSFFGWFVSSPTSGSKGRTFSLQSGKVESTETIYKYRMQVKEGEERASNLGSTSEQDSQDQQEGSDSNESGSASNDDDEEEEQ